jgi:nitric oxide reductase NorD protein
MRQVVAIAHMTSDDAAASERRATLLLKGNARLLEGYLSARAVLARRAEPADLGRWDDAVAGLVDANLGEVTLRIFLQLSERWPAERTVGDLAVLGLGARAVGREAGSRTAQTVLVELPKTLAKFDNPEDLKRILDTLRHLAEAAPESIQLVASRLEHLLTQADSEGFAVWISGGLRAGGSAARRRAYFSLDEPLSQRLLGLGGNASDFNRLERRLAAMFVALFGRAPRFRKLTTGQGLPLARRASFAGGIVGLPDTFPGFSGAAADAIYRAAVAHAGAHFTYSTHRFPVGQLKPLQITLVSLIEDARVEAMALRAMPGLARLWRPFHTVEPSTRGTVPALLMRLSRALIDPDYADDDGWIVKGRTLFAAAADRLDDPAISREIGGLLGNDIGQMRLQFNARNHVVEPPYRDDNHHLWDYGDQPDAPTEQIELLVDTVRLEQREDAAGQRNDPSRAEDQQSQRARAGTLSGHDGIPVATYPEWDYAAGVERPDWTTLLESDAPTSPRGRDSSAAASSEMGHDVAMLARNASVGRRIRQRRQPDGDALDLDASVAHAVERRAGFLPEARVYQRNIPGPRDLAVLLLLDLSQSTADRDRDGRDVLSVEREAAAILASALQEAGDAIAVHGFNSDSRERVHFIRVKEFDESMDEVVRARLKGLRSSHSTRLGTALRHAGEALAQRRAFRRVLLVLTDGEPSDIDVEDPRYLAEDARRVILGLRRRGIDTFAFGMGNGPFHQLDRIFGERRALRVPRIEVLPVRLMNLYSELKK